MDRHWGIRNRARLDVLGVGLSLACAVHCLMIPVLFAMVPALVVALHSFNAPLRGWSLTLLSLQAYEGVFVAIAMTVAAISIGLGWRRHRRLSPLVWLVAGCAVFWFVLARAGGSPLLHGLTSALGGLLLVAAHIANLSLRAADR